MREKPKRYVFRWKEDSIVVPSTWDHQEDVVWQVAIAMCRPAAMREASEAEVERYMRERGEVVEYEES